MFGFDSMDKFFELYVPKIISAILIVGIGYICVKVLVKFLRTILGKTKVEHTAITFVVSIFKVVLYIILILTAMSTVGINVNSIIAAVSAAALAAGLALQNTLSNVASGMIILISKPFVAGDILEFEGQKGYVQSIKIFTTTLHTLNNKIVTIPNSRLTSNNIVNCTMIDKRRLDLKYIVSYEDDLQKVKSVIFDIISKNDKVLQDPEAAVYVGEYLDNGIQIIVHIWVVPDDYYDVYYYMQENVKPAFDDNGITIPYPHIVTLSKN